jgi:hypothetical protein
MADNSNKLRGIPLRRNHHLTIKLVQFTGLIVYHGRYDQICGKIWSYELPMARFCESAVNYPVRWNGKTIGSLNLLHRAGRYNERNVAAISPFAALSVPALLDIARGWHQ